MFVVAAVEVSLVLAGAAVAANVVRNAYLNPEKLLNKSYQDPRARRLFLLHLAICVLHLCALGPVAVLRRDRFLYAPGNVLVLDTVSETPSLRHRLVDTVS